MKKRRTAKYWIREIHLWLGLTTGLVVLIVSLTGCLFVFQQEITERLHKDRHFVVPTSSSTLPLSILHERAQQALGNDRPILNIVTYRQPDRAWEFLTYKLNDTALTWFGAVEYYQSVFVNPYTGALTGARDYKYDFFSIVKYLHWSLLLNTRYGQPIVGYSTLFFVILLITGLVLWWPKRWNKVTRQRSFKIKWRAPFKRVNYDLHNVPGFYSLLPALVISLTGLVFVFPPFSPSPVIVRSKVPDNAPTAIVAPIDKAFQNAQGLLPAAQRIVVTPAAGKEDVIFVYGYSRRDIYYGFDALQFDRYTGLLLNRRNNKEKNAGERLIEMNYDIHVGAIGGLTGKIIAFIVSLICASLPVTGFLVWWGKRHPRNARNPRNTRHPRHIRRKVAEIPMAQ